MPGVVAAATPQADTPQAAKDTTDTLSVLCCVLRNVQLPWRTLCALLCTSNAASAIVDSSCAGTMDLVLKFPAPKDGAPRWLSKHAVLLRSLAATSSSQRDQDSGDDATPEDVAAALSKAAKVSGGLMLRELSTGNLPVLQAAASSSSRFLTTVDLGLWEEVLFPSSTAAVDCFQAVGGQLQVLKLGLDPVLVDAAHYLRDKTSCFKAAADDPVVKAVRLLVEGGQGGEGAEGREGGEGGSSMTGNSGGGGTEATEPTVGLAGLLRQAGPHLTALTKLEVDAVADSCLFQYAPSQLRELMAVGLWDWSHRGWSFPPREGVTPGVTSVLELGHLNALTLLDFQRNPDYGFEGWRVIRDKDTLPPNLVKLSVVTATSASPLLPLTKLQELSICAHCHLPPPELKRLSVLTQLQSVKLGYCSYRGGGGDDEAQKDSAGWSSVPALAELELHDMRVDPACDLLQHLASCTRLTRLVWAQTYLSSYSSTVSYRDGGLSALGAALPSSLRRLELSDFIPDAERGDGDAPSKRHEADIIMGLQNFAESVIALPQLESVVVMESDTSLFSQEGQEVIEMILNGMCGGAEVYDADEVFMAFCDAYPGFFEDSDGSGDEQEEGSGEEDEAGESAQAGGGGEAE